MIDKMFPISPALSELFPMHYGSKSLFCLSFLLVLSGCTHHSETQAPGKQETAYSTISDQALIDNVVNSVNHLDQAIVLDLTPPELVLDATKSRNRKEVRANFQKDPLVKNGPYDILVVTTNNGQFDRLQIGPGDQVRFDIVLPGQDIFAERTSHNAIVQQRLGPNKLRVVSNPFGGPLPYSEPIEVWRYSSELVRDLTDRMLLYGGAGKAKGGFSLPRRRALEKHQAVSCWEPTADGASLVAAVDRLSQWARSLPPQENWEPSPLIDTLPESLQVFVAPDSLDSETFTLLDARIIQEAIWARDIGRWAVKDPRFKRPLWGPIQGKDKKQVANLENALALFDWTVRHIQLQPAETPKEETPDAPALKPVTDYHQIWHTLLMGQGTAEQRGEIFSLLARQQGLNVVALAFGDRTDPVTGSPLFWASALYLDGELYLFDPKLGLPIPGPDGAGIATLSQVTEDPSLLRQLDLNETETYPVTADDLNQVVTLVDSSLLGLSLRGEMLEAQLAGRDKFVITPIKPEIVKQLESSPGITSVRLWDLPYRVLDAQLSMDERARRRAIGEFLVFASKPWLYKARVLHFQGKFDFEMIERLYDQETAEQYDNLVARYYYRMARPAEHEIQAVKAAQEQFLMKIGKANASYWLGLLALDDGDDKVAIDFFKDRTLGDSPGGPWTEGAHYNLGRTEELMGNKAAAAEQYEQTKEFPQGYGNRLRARWLTEGVQPPSKEATENENSSENASTDEPSAPLPEKPPSAEQGTDDKLESTPAAGDNAKPEPAPEPAIAE